MMAVSFGLSTVATGGGTMGVLLGIVFFGLSAGALLRLIGRFRRDWQAAEIVRGPAVPEQTIRFPVSGELSLFLEGPRYRTYQKRLQYKMHDEMTKAGVPVTPVLGGAGVRSLKHSRVQRGRFSLPAPGDYGLQIGGLGPKDAEDYAIVFMRPFTGRLLRFILTCVLLGIVLIGSLVLAILSAVL